MMKLADMKYLSLRSSVNIEEIKDFGNEVNRHMEEVERITESLLRSLATPN
jgi:hypothetical protein